LSRIKIRTAKEDFWLSVPIKRDSETLIKDVLVDNGQDWKARHLSLFGEHYRKAPYFSESLALLKTLYEADYERLCDLTIRSTEIIHEYFGYESHYLKTSDFPIAKSSNKSEHVIEMVKYFGADTILSAWGALKFYDFDLFERNGVRVEFIKYSNDAYPQIHGDFHLHVSVLDLIANCGKGGRQFLSAGTEYWPSFIKTPEAEAYLNK